MNSKKNIDFVSPLSDFISEKVSQAETLGKRVCREMKFLQEEAVAYSLGSSFIPPIEDMSSLEIYELYAPANQLIGRAAIKYAQLSLMLANCRATDERFTGLCCFLDGDTRALDLECSKDRETVRLAVEMMCAANYSRELEPFTIDEIYQSILKQLGGQR